MLKKKYFSKLLSVIFIFVIIYTILLSVIMFAENREMLLNEKELSDTTTLRKTKESIDNKLMIARNLILRVSDNKILWNYISGINDDYISETEIYSQLYNSLSIYSDDSFFLSLFKPDSNVIITSKYTADELWYKEELGFDETAWQKIIDFASGDNSDKYMYINSEGKENINYLSVIRCQNINNRGNVVFILSLKENELFPYKEEDVGGEFIILNGDKVISGKNDETIRKMIYDYREIEKKQKFKTQMVTVESGRYIVKGLYSEELDWQYIFYSDTTLIMKKLGKIIVNAVILLFISIVLGLICALFATKKLYKPIGEVVKSFGDYEKNGQNNEIEYISKVTEALKKSNDELHETINNNKDSLKTKFIMDILNGLPSEIKIESTLADYEILWFKAQCIILKFEIVNYKTLQEMYTKEDITMIQRQIGIVVRQELGQLTECETIEPDFKSYVSIIKSYPTETLKRYVTSLLNNIESQFNVRMMAGMSEVYDDLSAIHSEYQRLNNLMNYSMYINRGNAVWVDETEYEQSRFYNYPPETEKELTETVIAGDKRKTLLILNNLLDENLIRRNLGVEITQKFIMAMTVTIDRIAGQLGKSISELFEQDTLIYLELKMCSDTHELKNKIIDIYRQLLNVSSVQTSNDEHSVASNMLKFVEENYDKDLSLTDLAEKYNLSSGYVSTLFKKFTGENFKDYANICKINKAVELMTNNPDLKINEISEKVGCAYTNTFIRMFKRYKGVAPGQYIKKLEKND